MAGRPLGTTTALVWAVVLLAAVGAADAATDSELTLALFYVLPLALATWYGGPWWGSALALAASLATLGIDLAGHVRFSHPAYLYWQTSVHLGFYFAFVGALDTARTAHRKLEALAALDPLTQLPNRRAFLDAAESLRRISERRKRPLSVVMFDLDGFKQVNDTRGHDVGDAVLRAVAKALKAGRASDLFARLGGDEFAVVFPETDPQAARRAVERLLDQLRAAMREGGYAITFSVGCATFEGAPLPSVEAMLRVADRAMYAIKSSSKDGAELVVQTAAQD